MSTQRTRHTKGKALQAASQPPAGAAATPGNQPVAPGGDVHLLVAKRAYEIHAERGFRQGYALDEWLEAEREILTRSSGQ